MGILACCINNRHGIIPLLFPDVALVLNMTQIAHLVLGTNSFMELFIPQGFCLLPTSSCTVDWWKHWAWQSDKVCVMINTFFEVFHQTRSNSHTLFKMITPLDQDNLYVDSVCRRWLHAIPAHHRSLINHNEVWCGHAVEEWPQPNTQQNSYSISYRYLIGTVYTVVYDSAITIVSSTVTV